MSTSSQFKASVVRARVDPDLKSDATRILASCGLNVSDAVRLFFRQVVAQNGLPFEVKVPNAVTRAAMEEARSGQHPHYGSVEEMFDTLEKKQPKG